MPDEVLDPEGDLLGLGEEVVGVPVQHHAAHRGDGDQLLRHDLGRIEHVEAELLRLRLSEDLEPSSYSGNTPASMDSQRSRR